MSGISASPLVSKRLNLEVVDSEGIAANQFLLELIEDPIMMD